MAWSNNDYRAAEARIKAGNASSEDYRKVGEMANNAGRDGREAQDALRNAGSNSDEARKWGAGWRP